MWSKNQKTQTVVHNSNHTVQCSFCTISMEAHFWQEVQILRYELQIFDMTSQRLDKRSEITEALSPCYSDGKETSHTFCTNKQIRIHISKVDHATCLCTCLPDQWGSSSLRHWWDRQVHRQVDIKQEDRQTENKKIKQADKETLNPCVKRRRCWLSPSRHSMFPQRHFSSLTVFTSNRPQDQ